MKRLFAVFAVLVAMSVIIVACGGGGGGGGGTTAVTTTQQGAQSAKAGTAAAQNVLSGQSQITGMMNPGSYTGSPVVGKQTNAGKALTLALQRNMPSIKKAKAFALKKATQTQTSNCPDGGTEKFSYDDVNGIPITITYTGCKSGGTVQDGTIQLTGNADMTSMNIAVNMTVIGYDSTYTTKQWQSVDNFSASLSESSTTFTMTMNGTHVEDNFASTPKTKEETTFSNVSISGTDSSTASTMKYDETMNGAMDFKHYENGTLTSGDNESYGNFKVGYTLNTSTNVFTMSIDGSFTLATTPADSCADGTYVFKTVTPITYDGTKQMFTAGEISINDTVVVKYTSTGDVQVSIDGGKTFTSYTDTQFDAMCANL
ncbi:MAG: hypothetical protein M0042_15545 [Nitrospiraceae bacterium]|nr:hypothetical protein [Nitrospiraceae bacterium]